MYFPKKCFFHAKCVKITHGNGKIVSFHEVRPPPSTPVGERIPRNKNSRIEPLNPKLVGRVTPCAPPWDQRPSWHLRGAQRPARPTLRFMGSFDVQFWTRIGAMNRVLKVLLIINDLHVRFMESPLFLSDLLTAHEPDRVCAVRYRKQCGRCRSLVPCARWKDWFRWWITAHFGETRVGFPVGKICLLPEHHRAFGIEFMAWI